MAELHQVILKVDRAKKHIADLEEGIRQFRDTNPYKVEHRRAPQSRKLIYYVSSVEPTPPNLALIAGDAIQNLMSALDHLAYQLVLSDSNGNPPNPNWIYFPIRDTAADYEAKKSGKMEGLLQDTFDIIDTFKPYKGGNDTLWALYKLNNIEKHRLLITAGGRFRRMNIGPHISATLRKYMKEIDPGTKFEVPDFSLFLKPADRLFPLEVGKELFIGAPDEEPNENMQFMFDVALNEPQILEAKPLLETVRQMTGIVEDIVSASRPA